MADAKLKNKIRKVLKETYFSSEDDLVDVSDGDEDSIHVVIVSRKFDGLRMKEKNDLIWSILMKGLSRKEWGKVTLAIGRTPMEIKAM